MVGDWAVAEGVGKENVLLGIWSWGEEKFGEDLVEGEVRSYCVENEDSDWVMKLDVHWRPLMLLVRARSLDYEEMPVGHAVVVVVAAAVVVAVAEIVGVAVKHVAVANSYPHYFRFRWSNCNVEEVVALFVVVAVNLRWI